MNQRRKIESESVYDQYHGEANKGAWNQFLWGPFADKSVRWGALIVSMIMELLGTLLFTLLTNLAKFYAADITVPVNGLIVGVIGGSAYYVCTWKPLVTAGEETDVDRHLSWSVTMVLTVVARAGFVLFPFYIIMQGAGALIAGAIMYAGTTGALPTPPATIYATPNIWGYEILGSMLICFFLLAQFLGGSRQTEDERTRSAQMYAAFARALVTTATYGIIGSHSFDSVVYLAGFIGSCTTAAVCSANTANPFSGAIAFYLFVPLIGGVAALAVFLLLLLIYGYKRMSSGRQVSRNVSKRIPLLSKKE